MVSLENDGILLGTLIRKFRHLELQNLSTIADFRDRQEKSEEQEQQQQEQQEEEDLIIIEEDYKNDPEGEFGCGVCMLYVSVCRRSYYLHV